MKNRVYPRSSSFGTVLRLRRWRQARRRLLGAIGTVSVSVLRRVGTAVLPPGY